MILNKFTHNGSLVNWSLQSSRTDPFQTERSASFNVGLPRTACGFVSRMSVLDLAVFMLPSLCTSKLLIFHQQDLRWKLNSFVKLQLVRFGKEPCDQSRPQAPELGVRGVSTKVEKDNASALKSRGRFADEWKTQARPIVGSSKRKPD